MTSKGVRGAWILPALALALFVGWRLFRASSPPETTPLPKPIAAPVDVARSEALVRLAERMLTEQRHGAARVVAAAAHAAAPTDATRALLDRTGITWAPVPSLLRPACISFPVALSPDAARLAYTDVGVSVRRLERDALASIPEFVVEPADPVALAWSADGKRLAVLDRGRLRIESPADAIPKRLVGFVGTGARCVAFAARDSVACVGFEQGKMEFVPADAKSRRVDPDPLVFASDEGDVVRLAASPRGTRLAAGTDRGVVLLWDVASRVLLGKVHCEGPFALPGDGSHLYLGGESTLRWWEPGTSAPVATRVVMPGGIRCMLAAPSGRHVLYLGGESAIRIVDLTDERTQAVIDLDSEDGPSPTALALHVTSDEGLVSWIDSDRAVLWQWDARTRQRTSIEDPSLPSVPTAARASDARRRIQVEGDRIRVMDPDRVTLAVLEGHSAPVVGASLEGNLLRTRDASGVVIQWNVRLPDPGMEPGSRDPDAYGLTVSGDDVVPIAPRDQRPAVPGTWTLRVESRRP
jgi:hypothetical protein